MKKLFITSQFILTGIAYGQFCAKPDPNFCPGNIFTNGNFETITKNPADASDNNIDAATGWFPIWKTGSLADLYCESSSGTGNIPTPKSGIYASMWITNRNLADATWREGMFNKLQSTIVKNSGSYTFSFNTARLSTGAATSIEIGIYGINFSSGTLPNNPTNMTTPSNLDLFGAANSVLLGTVSVPANANNSWVNQSITFNSNLSTFPMAGINHILITKSDNILPGMAQMYMAFDNFCLRFTPTSFCGCDNTTNLIINGDFEKGATAFTSKFDLWNQNSKVFVPGMYSVIDNSGLSNFCKNWVSVGCGRDASPNKYLVVNGATGIPGYKTVWSQDVQLQAGKDYKLCMTLRNLPQCCFNVNPKVTITYFDGGKQQTLGPVIVTESACPGQKVTFNITVPANGIVSNSSVTSTISINLDQSGLGDGNDLAIDDIALIQLNKLPSNSFSISAADPAYINSTDFTRSFNIVPVPQNPPLPAGAGIWWSVAQLDANGNEVPGTKVENPNSSWWTIPCNFPGYNGSSTLNGNQPGIFKINTTYRVVFGTWGECFSWSIAKYTFRVDPSSRKIIVIKDNISVDKPKNIN